MLEISIYLFFIYVVNAIILCSTRIQKVYLNATGLDFTMAKKQDNYFLITFKACSIFLSQLGQ